MLGCALLLVAASVSSSYGELVVALGLVGAAGAAVNSASGRAVMHWFGADERGFALGVRQTAIPLGGFIGALSLPPIADAGGTEAAFLFLAGLSATGALVGVLILRGREVRDGIEASSIAATIGDGRLWRLSLGSGLFLYAQIAVLGFGVLFLVDEHGLSGQEAALVFAGSQVLGGAFRIGGGRWSDRTGARVVPLRLAGLGIVGVMLLTAVLAGGPTWLLVPVLGLAGGLTMAWNGLSFTAAAELAGALRSGATIGVQQTVLAAIGVAAPVVFAATVSSGSWPLAFAGRRRSVARRAGGCSGRSASADILRRDEDSRAAGRAVCDRRRAWREPTRTRAPPRTRHTSSRPGGCARPGSRSRSTRAETSSATRLSGRTCGSDRISTPCRREVASTARSGSSAASKPSSERGADRSSLFRGEEVGCVGSRALVARGAPLPAAFLELHVEQGPVLANADAPLGVVTGIVGYASSELVFDGQAGHAGTTPMDRPAGRARGCGRGNPADQGRGALDRGRSGDGGSDLR